MQKTRESLVQMDHVTNLTQAQTRTITDHMTRTAQNEREMVVTAMVRLSKTIDTNQRIQTGDIRIEDFPEGLDAAEHKAKKVYNDAGQFIFDIRNLRKKEKAAKREAKANAKGKKGNAVYANKEGNTFDMKELWDEMLGVGEEDDVDAITVSGSKDAAFSGAASVAASGAAAVAAHNAAASSGAASGSGSQIQQGTLPEPQPQPKKRRVEVTIQIDKDRFTRTTSRKMQIARIVKSLSLIHI